MVSAYNTRIQHRRDTSANWTAENPILLDGEIIVVVTEAGEVRHKTGDGVKTYTQLPFDDEAVRNLVNNKANADHVHPQPDWNQNDESQPNAILNRPFGDTLTGGDTLTWNGNTDGLVSTYDGAGWYLYHVSDSVPTIDDFSNGGSFATSSNQGNARTVEYSDNVIGHVFGMYYIALEDNASWHADGVDILYPLKGVYFAKLDDEYSYVLTINGYTGFPSVKQIDARYLPDGAGAADAIATLAECGIVTPAVQDETIYTSPDGEIYVI